MNAEFRLPDLGEGLPEAEIVQWLVAEGDEVTLNQPIAEVETAKAIVELPSPFAGTVQTLHAAAGDVVAVGSPLIVITVPGDEPTAASGGTAAHAVAAASGTVAEDAAEPERAIPNLVGYGAAPRASGRPQRRAVRRGAAAAGAGGRSGATASDTAVLDAAPHDLVDSAPPLDVRHERPRSTPPVRQLAKQLGVDLALIEASGVTAVTMSNASPHEWPPRRPRRCRRAARRSPPARTGATRARPSARPARRFAGCARRRRPRWCAAPSRRRT